MFLKCYLEMAADFEDVRDAMLGSPEVWLQGLVVEADHEGACLLADVGLQEGRHEPHRAQLEVGAPQVGRRLVSLPIRLRRTGSERLFSTFDGSLDAAWLGRQRTQLALTVQYQLPLAEIEPPANRALLHRVAETMARGFLEHAARRLGERLGLAALRS
jgi:hypothetical protein